MLPRRALGRPGQLGRPLRAPWQAAAVPGAALCGSLGQTQARRLAQHSRGPTSETSEQQAPEPPGGVRGLAGWLPTTRAVAPPAVSPHRPHQAWPSDFPWAKLASFCHLRDKRKRGNAAYGRCPRPLNKIIPRVRNQIRLPAHGLRLNNSVALCAPRKAPAVAIVADIMAMLRVDAFPLGLP